MPAATLSTTTTAQSLLSLIQALGTVGNINYANTLPMCKNLIIRGDDSLSSTYVYQGDSNVSSSNYGTRLAAGDSISWTGVANDVSLASKYVVGSANGAEVDVTWEVA
jgi:hypothetical protein